MDSPKHGCNFSEKTQRETIHVKKQLIHPNLNNLNENTRTIISANNITYYIKHTGHNFRQ